MMCLPSRAGAPARRPARIASTLTALALLAACSDGGITIPQGVGGPPGLSAITIDSAGAEASGPRVSTGPLSNGGVHTGSIAAAGQTDVWTFNAVQGQLLVVAMGETGGSADFTPWLRLQDPNGALISQNFNPAAAQITVNAPLSGTYTVLVASNDGGMDGTGTYRLTAAQLQGTLVVSPGDQGGAVTNGSNHPGTIDVGDVDFWTFTASAGDAIILAIGEVSSPVDLTPWIRLVSPTGTILGSAANVGAAQIQVNAPATGQYTVVVGTNDTGFDATGTYSLTLAKSPGAIVISPGDQGGPMTNGSTHAGTIPVGDLDAWTFNASQNDYIILSMGEGTSSASFTPWLRLVSPTGSVVASNSNARAAQISFRATVTGTYLVVVGTNDAGVDDTGDYTVTLAKGPGALTISPGDQGGNMTNGANHAGTITLGDVDAYTFTANQGDGFVVAVGEVSSPDDFTPWIRVVSPTGVLLGSSSNVAAAQVQLNAPATGSYMVVVGTNDPGFDATGTYTLTIAKGPGAISTSPGDQGGAATNGGNDLGTIHVGDLDVYTFTTNQGLPFAVSLGEITGSADFTPWIRIISPTGSFLNSNSNPSAAQVSGIAPATGQYTVIVSTNDAGVDGSGDYRLVVQKAGAFVTPAGDEGGALTNGAVHTGTIVTGDLDRWTISANAGETIAVAVGETSGNDFTPWIRFVAPNGQFLGNSSNVLAAQVTVTAPLTGTYTVAVGTNDVGFDGTGSYTITVAKAPGAFVVSPGDQGGAISNGVQNGAIAIGDLDMWSVTANAGSPIQMTMTEVSGSADFTPWIRLVAPSGAIIANNAGAASAMINVAAPTTGTYTVILGTNDGGVDGSGSYTLSVSGVNLAPDPNLVPVVGRLTLGMSPRPKSYGPEGSR